VRIIGVIDLKDGKAVHARGGRRDAYAPVSKAAGAAVDGDAVVLARVYLETFGIQELYVADLNAIESGVLQEGTIRAVSALGATVYVDAGVTNVDTAQRLIHTGVRAVIGLETLPSFDVLKEINRHASGSTVFSVDLRDGALMNTVKGTVASPEEAARRALAAGVTQIIVLDVARVGTTGGPDIEVLTRIRAAVPGADILAGGGVRNLEDLKQLAAIGCDGALVASALLNARLTKSDIAKAERL
jgi:phosphoribosylformimino-5-aminoimidazole carboxamide ribotide isomerase